jgi:hypothetical protein
MLSGQGIMASILPSGSDHCPFASPWTLWAPPLRNPFDLKNYGFLIQIFKRTYQNGGKKQQNLQGYTHVSLPTKAQKSQTTPLLLQQICLWEHFPSPENFGITYG